ncbi:hypothetical protein SAMN05421505_1247 [Sinosporangium album]|uniref:Histidine kinase-like ATPase domain-containing protein n=1 Tax=Sinosporangium album TaxID=504805 RepID=A0A1G8FMV6_9ACTN|nr:hypothetical protein [Sinosporangium album]SDH83326.1 hypothetical protein SAMN05421505_1247 [Sinosporangium album]
MYEQILPITAESPESARASLLPMARLWQPDLAAVAAATVEGLVAMAVRSASPAGKISVKAAPTDDGAIYIEVHHFGGPVQDGNEWAAISAVASTFGARHSDSGHLAWVELRPSAPSSRPVDRPRQVGPTEGMRHRQ